MEGEFLRKKRRGQMGASDFLFKAPKARKILSLKGEREGGGGRGGGGGGDGRYRERETRKRRGEVNAYLSSLFVRKGHEATG